MGSEPQCLWAAGVIITKEWTALKDYEYMNEQDIDGSTANIGASAYAGWGMWSPDNPNVQENGPLKGRDQGSDRAEVRALVAALEKTTSCI
eukprot:818418-Heterocapsa_arctica.AAC.1